MSAADAKKTLLKCEEGIDLAKATLKSNDLLTSDYNLKNTARSERQSVANVKLEDWAQRRGDYAKYKGFEDNFPFNSSATNWTLDCVWPCSDSCWYPGTHTWSNEVCVQDAKNKGYLHPDDYYYTGESWHDGGGGCDKRKQVRWKCAKRANRITDWRGEYDNVKPSFTEAPVAIPQLNTTAVVISCCANSSTIIGSEIKDTTINQQNLCLSTKKQELEDLEAKEVRDAENLAAQVIKDTENLATQAKLNLATQAKLNLAAQAKLNLAAQVKIEPERNIKINDEVDTEKTDQLKKPLIIGGVMLLILSIISSSSMSLSIIMND
jgi:hypothetical protein